MALISIIVPCYNVENYIDRCMDSLARQTIGIDNLEIILVNDASTDNTLVKLQQWEEHFPNSVLIITYDENIRQGGARNVGLQYASSNYIGFVDSDDWIECDMYETLYSFAVQKDYDVVKCKYIRDKGTGVDTIPNGQSENQEYEFSQRAGFYSQNIQKVGNVGSYGGIWSGLYKKSLIIENNLFFPEKIAYEDNYWSSILSLYQKNLYIVDRVLYHYFVNEQSTVLTRNAMHHLDRMDIELAILETYKELGAFDVFYHELEKNFIQKFYLNTLYILFTRFDYLPDIINTMLETVAGYFPDCKSHLDLTQYSARQRMLLELLDKQDPLTAEEQLMIKYRYLEAMVKDK